METTQAIAQALLSQERLSDQDHQRLTQLGYFPCSSPRSYDDGYPEEDDHFWEPTYPDEPHPHTPSTRRKPPQRYRRKDGERALELTLKRIMEAHQPLGAPASARQHELLSRLRSAELIRSMRQRRGDQAADHAWHAALNARDAQELSGHVWVLRRASIAKAYNLYREHLARAQELFELNRVAHQRLLRDAAHAPASARWSLKLWHAAAQHERRVSPFIPSPLSAWAAQPDELDWLTAWHDLRFLAPRTLARTLSRYLHAQQRASTALAPPQTPLRAAAAWRGLLGISACASRSSQERLMWPLAITLDAHDAPDPELTDDDL